MLGEDPLPEELLFLTERDSGLNQSLAQKTWRRRKARWKPLQVFVSLKAGRGRGV